MTKKLFAIASAMIMLASCSKGYFSEMEGGAYRDGAPSPSAASDEGGESENGGRQGEPGKVTAGEWNDLDNWAFWGDLMTPKEGHSQEGQDDENQQEADYSTMTAYWGFNTGSRVAVKLTDGNGNPVAGIPVALKDGDKTLWKAVTDVFGRADCWAGMFKEESVAQLSLTISGAAVPGTPKVTTWSDTEVQMNEYTTTVTLNAPQPKADILFIVDATGSMMDEIDFLKADLMDILEKVQELNGNAKIRTGALFYRDEGDTYLTRVSKFTDKISTTINFIGDQSASGGGDYPEAVHTALEHSLQKLSWDKEARTKLVFMLLDAPAHQDHQGVVERLHKSIASYAENGIKLIPVASSGVDKNTEFMLRFFSIATGGTYVFITNDSGIGNDHMAPTVGQFEVEYLNDLMIRLINKYLG